MTETPTAIVSTNSTQSNLHSSTPSSSLNTGSQHTYNNTTYTPPASATLSTGTAAESSTTPRNWTSASYKTSSSMQPATSAIIATTVSPSSDKPTSAPGSAGGLRLDNNAIIAGVAVGTLLVAIIVVGVCLAKAKQRRGGRGAARERQAKTPRPTPAGAAAAIAREPNPYTNTCFDASREEMGERVCQLDEPAIVAPGSINSLRNKEDNWIIPLEELAEDETMANFDTTRF